MDLLGYGLIAILVLLLARLLVKLFGGPRKQARLEPVSALSESETKKIIQTFPEARIERVKDGDTFDAVVDGGAITIRLSAIDCPEDGQAWGDIATYGLIKMIGKQKVRLECHGVDDYGRTLATAYVWKPEANEWTNVNERMVMLGHAWVLHKFCGHLPPDRKDRLNRLERWARGKKVGLWKQENPAPPWLWRRNGQSADMSR